MDNGPKSEDSYTFYYNVVINRFGATELKNVTVSATTPELARQAADTIASGIKGWIYDDNTVSVVKNPRS